MIEKQRIGIEGSSVKEKDPLPEYQTEDSSRRVENSVGQQKETVAVPSDIEAEIERAYTAVEALPGLTIETRLPAVDERTIETVVNPLVSREWTLVTEVIKRRLPQSDVQTILRSFIDKPVSQHLAGDMLDALQANPEIGSVLKRSGTHLTDMLAFEEVPEEAMSPDIKNTSRLSHPVEDVQRFRLYNTDEERIKELLKEQSEGGAYTTSLSPYEAPLVLKKYTFARDVKLLALGAELAETGEVNLDEEGEVTLPSGTRLKISGEHSSSPVFLDPSKWEYRRQFKDRVYEIGVDGKKYFLKERKTSRHKDTLSGGHRDGLTSSEEFEVAVALNNEASVDDGEVRVSWEKPVGFVEYPDGFSFAVFEYEEALEPSVPTAEVEEVIRDNPEAYSDEYEAVKKKINNYLVHPLVKDAAAFTPITPPKRRFGFFGKQESLLDYEAFAEAKASYLCYEARELVKEKALDLGYRNTDSAPANGYRLIRGENNRVAVEVVGFDYELYEHDPERVEKIRENTKEARREMPGLFIPAELQQKPLELAAYLAIREMNKKSL